MDVVMAVAIGAIAVVLAMTTLTSRPLNLAGDLQDFALNLRVTREWAMGRNLHYRLRVLSGTPYQYVIEQGSLTGAPWWTSPTVVRTVKLRQNIAFPAGTQGTFAEFDTRGQSVFYSPWQVSVTFTLQDVARGWTKTVTVSAAGLVDQP